VKEGIMGLLRKMEAGLERAKTPAARAFAMLVAQVLPEILAKYSKIPDDPLAPLRAARAEQRVWEQRRLAEQRLAAARARRQSSRGRRRAWASGAPSVRQSEEVDLLKQWRQGMSRNDLEVEAQDLADEYGITQDEALDILMDRKRR
jgi:hypothetical protein